MNLDFEIFNHCLGEGNPKGIFWTIGIEEGESISADNLKIKKEEYNCLYRTVEPIEEKSSDIYDIACKLINGLDNQEYYRYRCNHYLQEDSNEFHSNLYPLGKPSTNTPITKYRDLFGINSYEDYEQYVKNSRWPKLLSLWKKSRPSITFCFGKTYWSDFIELLELTEEPFEKKNFDDREFMFYPQSKVMLTPFFSYGRGMSHKRIVLVRKYLKSKYEHQGDLFQ